MMIVAPQVPQSAWLNDSEGVIGVETSWKA